MEVALLLLDCWQLLVVEGQQVVARSVAVHSLDRWGMSVVSETMTLQKNTLHKYIYIVKYRITTHTHACIHTHTQMYAHTHTHTHTRYLRQAKWKIWLQGNLFTCVVISSRQMIQTLSIFCNSSGVTSGYLRCPLHNQKSRGAT